MIALTLTMLHRRLDSAVSPIDVLLWQDAFWCYREEYCPAMGRDASYSVLLRHSNEWSNHLLKTFSGPES
jgi:hypothetical protein